MLASVSEGALAAIRSAEPSQPLSALQRLRRLVALERGDIATLCWYSAMIGLLSLAVPIAAQALVNTVAFTALGQPIVVLSLLVMLGLTLAAWLRTLRMQTVERLQQRLLVRAAHDAVLRVTRGRFAALVERGGPELMNRFFDVVTLQKAAAKLLVDGLSIALQSGVSLLLLAFYHPALLAFDVLLIGAIGIVVVPLGRGGVASAIAESKHKYRIAAWLEEVAGGVRAFKVAGADQLAFARADALAADYVRARRRQFTVVLRQTIASHVVQILAISGLLGLGGWLVVQGELTLGQLVAAELVVAGVTSGLSKLGQQIESFYDLTASVDKLGAIVDLAEEPPAGQLEPAEANGGARLSFEDVSYRYPDGARGVDGLSFALDPGAQLAVLGHDSSGKSTLAELCFGLREPSAGVMRIDGVDVRDLRRTRLRRDVALVGQSEVFDASVVDNVLMGAPQEQCDVLAALRAAALDDDVAALPEGVSTKLGHGGARLTQSQASRLMLARALARKPRLLVIDEALDSLGSATIERILQGLRRDAPRMSLLVLTSREDVAARMDRCLRLVDGRVTQEVES